MNVFGVGPLEMIVILVVALIFVGPERLPRLAADIARTIKEIRKYTGGLAAEFNEVVKDVERDTTGAGGVWKDVAQGIGGATQQVTEVMRTARKEMFSEATTPGAPQAAGENGAGPSANGSALAGWVDIPEPPPAGAQPGPAEPAAGTVTDPAP